MRNASIGQDVWKWPEFKALAERLGIPDLPKTRGVTITVMVGEAVQITHHYFGQDKERQDESSNTGS